MKKILSTFLGAAFLLAWPLQAQQPPKFFSAALTNNDGLTAGLVRIDETPKGLLFTLEVSGLTEGWHAAHLHGIGDCSDHGDHFMKAGGHAFREGEEHGFRNPKGPHSGDLPNIWVHADGVGKAHFYASAITLAELGDADGSAFMIHEKADDYMTQPAGEAGDRIACGVIRQQ